MTIDYEQLLKFKRELSQSYTVRDTLLYALGVGAGIDANTPEKLRHVYEEHLEALPTMSVVLAAPGFWLREPQFGVDWEKVLHGEQAVTMHKSLPVHGEVSAVVSVDAIYDKGAGKGALLYTSRILYDQTTGDLLASIRQGVLLRGNGGQGGLTAEAPRPPPTPVDREADLSITLATRPEQALLYRLSGDFNPLHADPAVAAKAGFHKPILHGLATYGVVGRALLETLCQGCSARLKRMNARFSNPVYPGEALTTEIWHTAPGRASFRALVAERATVVLSHGHAEYQ